MLAQDKRLNEFAAASGTLNYVSFGIYENTCNESNLTLWREIKSKLSHRGVKSIASVHSPAADADLSPKASCNSCKILSDSTADKWTERVARRKNVTSTSAKKTVANIERRFFEQFTRHRPAMFVGWNTFEYPFGIAGDVAAALGIPVWCFETGIVPGTIRCETTDYSHHLYDEMSDLSSYRSTGARLTTTLSPSIASVHPQRTKLRDQFKMFRSRGMKILVLGSVESGAGQFPQGTREKQRTLPGFRDCAHIAETISTEPNCTVFYKPHPYACERLPEPKANIQVMRSDPIRLIKNMDVVVTSPGKLEVAAVLSRKPVIRVGRSFLSGCPLGAEVNSESSLLRALRTYSTNFDPCLQIKQLQEAIGFLYQNGWLMPQAIHSTTYCISKPPVDQWTELALPCG